MVRSGWSSAAVVVAAAAMLGGSGCVSLTGPFDLPSYRGFARGASTGPHVFFAVSSDEEAFLQQTAPGRVMVYSLQERAVREIEGDTGAFAVDGEELLLVRDGALSRFRPGPEGDLTHVETLVADMDVAAAKIAPAGPGRILAGLADEVRLYERPADRTDGPLSAQRTVFRGEYLDFSYDAHDDAAWVIEGDHHHVCTIALAGLPEHAEPPSRQVRLPDGWSGGPDPVVPGADYALVFDRNTILGALVVVDKRTGTSTSLGAHMGWGEEPDGPDDGRWGWFDVAHIGSDRFLVSIADADDDERFALGDAHGATVVHEVDLAARTITPRAVLPKAAYSIVPDPEGVVVGGRGQLYLLDHDWRIADTRDLRGATPLLRGMTMAANATITTTASVGGAVLGTALAIGTAPIWGTWLLIEVAK